MKSLGLNEIRSKFLEYFGNHNHLVQPSYPLVPHDDKTLMFIVAGMVPLKDYFSGLQTPPHTRMATSQKCIRTNDIENVGRTARHASFFEMLGNFSFGDYFKKEAISLAWDFVTNVLEMPKDKLWVSIYEEDDEAFEIWKNQEHVPADRIIRMGKADNFWEMGTGTGPCGPCSEIYFDRGEKYNEYEGECRPGGDGDRFIEFWNLVFTQFEKQEDGSLKPLEKKNIDTGMGLERIACIMQGVDSIYDVDVFQNIIQKIAKIAKLEYGKDEKMDISMRVITDHMRSVTFLITDGVIPNNEGRGYVLRMLLRRAARHGRLLGIKENFLSEVAQVIIDQFKEAYPDLAERAEYTKNVISAEEDKFSETIDSGLGILEKYIEAHKKSEEKPVLSGVEAFKLYDTYGFPLDLTLEILKEHGMDLDKEEFDEQMKAQRERARSSRNKAEVISQEVSLKLSEHKSEFVGYDERVTNSKILAMLVNAQIVESASQGQEVSVILDKTPFYAESGGQISDIGVMMGRDFVLEIKSVRKLSNGTHLHVCEVCTGDVKVGEEVISTVGEAYRLDIMKNHTATHLLHKALKLVLDDSVSQAGSYVGPDRLRFDFTYFKAMTQQQIQAVEEMVNAYVFHAKEVVTRVLPIEEALKTGAQHLFSEKYGEVVRVVSIADSEQGKEDFSIEFCGGTHCKNTSEIGIFKILSENAVAAGVRRIEAITGKAVYEHINRLEQSHKSVLELLKTNDEGMITRLHTLISENKSLKKEIADLNASRLRDDLSGLKKNAVDKGEYQIISQSYEDMDTNALKELADDLANDEKPTMVVFSNVVDGKIMFIVKLNKACVALGQHAGNIAKSLAQMTGGNGGGKPEMAQAGGKDVTKVKEAMDSLLK